MLYINIKIYICIKRQVMCRDGRVKKKKEAETQKKKEIRPRPTQKTVFLGS